MPRFDSIRARLRNATEGEDDVVALMATVVQELHNSDARFDWTGFYRVAGPGMLKLGPFQGGPACTSIPFGRGVCGAAARTGTTQVVPDVDAFADHIACASTTRSEIVVPVRDGAGTLLGVLDIDSDELDAFDELDAERLALLLEDTFGRLNAGPAELDIAV